MPTEKDPVCKMDVQPEKAADKSQHKGQTYYFCSSECKREFENSPERYAKGEKQKSRK
jgi:Cu+-exporting ATPase